VILAGDLNDLPESWALGPLLADRALADAGAGLPPDEAWTWSGGGLRERIDDVLLAPGAGLLLAAAVAGGDDVAGASDHRPFAVDVWLDRPL
jgi:endonuclease/exonuclease/phosphatase family metal-dependent hydrolase